MGYDYAEGAWMNQLLRSKVFKSEAVSSEEVKSTTGLEISELVMCWLFEHTNNFKAALDEWKQSGARLDYREIQGY